MKAVANTTLESRLNRLRKVTLAFMQALYGRRRCALTTEYFDWEGAFKSRIKQFQRRREAMQRLARCDPDILGHLLYEHCERSEQLTPYVKDFETKSRDYGRHLSGVLAEAAKEVHTFVKVEIPRRELLHNVVTLEAVEIRGFFPTADLARDLSSLETRLAEQARSIEDLYCQDLPLSDLLEFHLPLLSIYARAVTGEPHHEDIALLLQAAFEPFGKSSNLDGNAVRNRVLRFRRRHSDLYQTMIEKTASYLDQKVKESPWGKSRGRPYESWVLGFH